MDTPQPADPPVVEGRRVRLRAITPADYEFLYGLSVHPLQGYRWRFRGRTPSPERFASELWSGVHAQYLVEGRSTHERLGQVVAYNAQPDNGHCYVGAVGAPGARGSGVVVEGLALFANYLFTAWPLRKLYAEVPEYTLLEFMSSIGRYVDVQGRLTEHDYYDGRFWDLLILSITRERFLEVRDQVIGSMQLRGELPVTLEEFREAVGRRLSVDLSTADADTKLTEAGLDSLHLVEVASWLADLGVEFPDELWDTVGTLGELYEWWSVRARLS